MDEIDAAVKKVVFERFNVFIPYTHKKGVYAKCRLQMSEFVR